MKIKSESQNKIVFESFGLSPKFTVYCVAFDVSDKRIWKINLTATHADDHEDEMSLSSLIGSRNEVIDEAERIIASFNEATAATSGINAEELEISSNSVGPEITQYTDFQHWAYEWYKLEWCIDRGVLPNDVDTEVGINGGECYVCLNEFVDNELTDNVCRSHYQRIYFLTKLLSWIKCSYSPNGASIMEYELKMSKEELWAYASVPHCNMSPLEAYRTVLSRHYDLVNARVDELIRSALNHLKTEKELNRFIVDFFVYNSNEGNEAEIDIEYLNRYIELGFVSQNELFERDLKLNNRCKKIGARFTIMPYTDGGLLHCFWYRQGMVAHLEYKNYVAEFFVQGDVDAHLYDENGYIKLHISHSDDSVGLRENEEVFNAIQNDVVLSALEETGKLEFFVQPWVELVIRDQMTNRVIKKQWVNDNILAAVEDNFDDIIKTIDKITNKDTYKEA